MGREELVGWSVDRCNDTSTWASHQRGGTVHTSLPFLPLSYLEEGFELWRNVGRELDGILDDVVEEGVDGVCVEGRLADVQLVQDDTQ